MMMSQTPACVIHQFASGVLIGRFCWDLLQGEEGFDPKGVQRVQHQRGRPEVGETLEERPACGEERDQIRASAKWPTVASQSLTPRSRHLGDGGGEVVAPNTITPALGRAATIPLGRDFSLSPGGRLDLHGRESGFSPR